MVDFSDVVWDVVQQQQIYRNRTSATKANRSAEGAQRSTEELEDRLERLTLVTQAMWELLSDQLSLSKEQLLSRIEVVDMRDGVRDGKITKQGARCANCHRVSSKRHAHCLYCGQNLDREVF